ncbi:MAG: glycoside hydrolase family 3 protein [Lachnospiraceae bacterium]|nr:glycoside hydrolase family 3 protein [Lachnospiraceae bacterium]
MSSQPNLSEKTNGTRRSFGIPLFIGICLAALAVSFIIAWKNDRADKQPPSSDAAETALSSSEKEAPPESSAPTSSPESSPEETSEETTEISTEESTAAPEETSPETSGETSSEQSEETDTDTPEETTEKDTESSPEPETTEASVEESSESVPASAEETTPAETTVIGAETTAEATSEMTAEDSSEESGEGSETDTAEEPTEEPGGDSTEATGEETEESSSEREVKVKTTPEDYLAEMTLHEKICQMFIAAPSAVYNLSAEEYAQNPYGGLILFNEDMTSVDGTVSKIKRWQDLTDDSGIGLFISVDEEGGLVARVASSLHATTVFSSPYHYKEGGPERARLNARTIGSEIHALGFNLDFAPVADTWSNPDNRVIYHRAYSDNFEEAATLVAAAVQGFHEGGVLCVVKHFPGHGDTAEDSHSGAAYCYKTLDELRKQELLPFISGINAGADMVMIGHITLPELDSLPASLSRRVITGLLRQELGYNGIVITDSLSMGAMVNTYGAAEIAVMTVSAGTDILLTQSNVGTMVTALERAVANGTISEARIDASVLRILQLKQKYGLLH